MKTIYKSIALEAALLSVTLALQAEIQSEGQTVTADVQASSLDRLKVTLVSPNVSGARDLVASGNATIEGNEIAVNLENLAFGTHRLVVSARFGTQIRTLYALDISVPQAELPNETQEYEDEAIVVSTYGDGGGGGEFPTDYAKQGDNPTATLTDTQAYAKAAAEAAQSLIAVDADIFAGKQALATNISAKGIPTAVADALTTMATKVLQIPQQINTGISDFEQMIAPSPYMWNVYTVATDLMKQDLPAYISSYMAGGNYVQYRANNAFFVGEYYLGYDTLELTGADGYLTCDGDFYTISGEVGSRLVTHTLPDGTVEAYPAESIIHTWHDSESGYINRWVAFLYLTNAYSFTNITSSICPRRVALCGTCLSFIVSGANRLTDVWVIGILEHFEGGATGNTWNTAQVVRNYQTHSNGYFYTSFSGVSLVMPDLMAASSPVLYNCNVQYVYFPSLKTQDRIIVGSEANLSIFDAKSIEVLENRLIEITNISQGSPTLPNLSIINLNNLVESRANIIYSSGNKSQHLNSLKEINLQKLETIGAHLFDLRSYSGTSSDFDFSNLTALRMPSLKRCSTALFLFSETGTTQYNFRGFVNLIDVEVGEMETSLKFYSWLPTNVLSDTDKKTELVNNVKNHILANVSDRTGLTQLTFTVSTTLYNAIASENITWQDQTMTLADAFLTKNWLLAGV